MIKSKSNHICKYCLIHGDTISPVSLVAVYDSHEEALLYKNSINVNKDFFRIIEVPYNLQFD